MKKTKKNSLMKRKLTIYILLAIIAVFVLVTTLFINSISYQKEENTKRNFKIYTEMINDVLKEKNSEEEFGKIVNTLKDQKIRVTILDLEGNLIVDSFKDEYDSEEYNIKSEILESTENGQGFNVRRSEYLNKNMIYYAEKFDSYIIRISEVVEIINSDDKAYIYIYVLSIISTVGFSIWIASKLSYIISKPISDLEKTTSLIAEGELWRRVKISSKDEIGQLGESFNEMADKLELTLNEVKEKQNRLSAILQSMDSGVIAIDINNNIIMVNPYAKKIFNICEEVIGKNIKCIGTDFDIFSIFQDADENYNEIKIEKPKEIYLRIRTADIINRNQHIGKVAVIQDVTDIKRLENVRSEFVANVSHELKTPLTSIKGFTETLRYVDDDETRNKFLGIIEEESDRLTRLISDILALSDIEREKEFKLVDVNINDIIVNIFELMKNSAKNRNIKLDLELDNVGAVKGDVDKIKQMIINLLDNAIKYSEGENIIVRSINSKNYCILEVEDDGVGISKEHLSRLFERFYRVDKTRSRASGGTGLGLAIVKHIALKLQGEIGVESTLGKGTKFIIKLPYI